MPGPGPQRLADLLPKPPSGAGSQDRRPLAQTNPVIASLRDLLGGFSGLQDALTPESSTATVLGAGLSAMLPLAVVRSLGRGAKAAKLAEPIKAYHGSPHDFDKFSLSKIGTGEGAQAYGHGLYFAENEGVAADYRAALSPKEFNVGGKIFRVDDQGVARDATGRTIGTTDQTIQDAVMALQRMRRLDRPASELAEMAESELQTMRSVGSERARAAKDAIASGQVKIPSQGRTYEVALHASPDEFLDWDTPLSQQSEKAREAIRKTFQSQGKVEPVKLRDGTFGVTQVQPDGSGRLVAGVVGQETPEQALKAFDEYLQSGTGMNAYWELGRSAFERDPAKASEALKAVGLKGIRYLDQGSRNAAMISPPRETTDLRGGLAWEVDSPTGTRMFTDKPSADAFHKQVSKENERTSNYVVFDDAIIDIMKKYGVALPVAAAMKAQMDQQQSGPQRLSDLSR